MKRFFLLFAFSALWICMGQASLFRNYQQEDGLSHNSVWTVLQDSEGFLWFGTNDGLNRFDGKEFKIYRKLANDPFSLGHNFIHSLKEDSRHRLLVGTRNGLYRYDRMLDRFEYIPISGQRDKEVNVNDILEDLDGNIWVACHGEGLFRLNADLQVEASFTSAKGKNNLPSNYLWTIVTDHYGNLWIGTAGNGLVHFDPQNGIFTPIHDRDDLNIENQSIYSVFCDKDNTLWIGTSTNGLFKYNHITGKAKHYLKDTGSVKSISPYSTDELIMGSEKGLVVFNKKEETYRLIRDNATDNATDNSIFAIARDSEGAFWIGTYFGGVNYFSPTANEFLCYNNLQENISSKYIVSGFAEESNGTVLISTHNNNVIYRFHPQTQRHEKAYEVSHNNVQSLLRVGDQLYASMYGRGVDVLSLKTGRIITHLDINTIEGKSLFNLSNGGIVFVLEEGGCIYQQPDGQRHRLNKLSNMLVSDVLQDDRGTVWFATYNNGLFAWKTNGSWQHYTGIVNASFNFAENGLTCMAEDGPHLWIGTKDRGIVLFDVRKEQTIRTFGMDEGLPNGSIYSMLCDETGNVWVSTKEGIARISAEEHKIKVFGYIGQEIQYNACCALRGTGNRLYFGGSNGFIMLQPDNLVINESRPPVIITNMKISNKPVIPGEKQSPLKQSLSETEKIVLKRNQSNFGFDFAALSFVSPNTNQYAYMLEGFDKDWTYTTEGTAQYMNIPSGKYVFRVKGTNNDGVWSKGDTHIAIWVKPPFWLSWGMVSLYAFLLASTVFIAFKRYLYHLDKQNKEKQYKFQMAKEREMYEQKINFFTNIAHEIRTPLSLITAPLESIIQSQDGTERTKKNLLTIERNTNRLLDLVNQLLDFRKIENDMFLLNLRYQNVAKIVQKVYDQYAQEAESKGIALSLHLPGQKLLSYVDAEALYKIVSNLLSNAVKFARSKITVVLRTEDDRLFLSVEDDGMGIPEELKDKIFEPFYQVEVTSQPPHKGSGLGLSLSRLLAQKLRGDISVSSVYGEGCLFTLQLPILADSSAVQSNETEQPAEATNTIETATLSTTPQKTDVSILLVEDNEELRAFMHEALADHYAVYEAEDGKKALEMLEEHELDIIISDIVMPGIDGIELCNELKTNPAYSHLPIILLSAKTDTATKIDGLKKGADVYMEKPFSLEQLKAQVGSIIENRANIRKRLVESPLHYFKRNKDNSESAEFIKRLNAFISDNMSNENFSIDSLSSEFAISRTNFQKKIKSITGLTPNDYIKLVRLNKSAELLATGKYRINEVCFLVGFNTPSYFSKCFYDHFGKLPKDFMQNKQE